MSLVDGFNLPMAIIPDAANCPVASCPIDLNPQCPAQLVGPRDPTGLVVGCNSACSAGLDNAGACLVPLFLLKSDLAFARGAADSANCCTGTHNSQTTCPSSGVGYYTYFSAYSSSPPSSTPVSPFLTSPYRPHSQRATVRTRTPMHLMGAPAQPCGRAPLHSTATTRLRSARAFSASPLYYSSHSSTAVGIGT